MGVCFGGCLAYAVAECLQRQGHHVENLALIDTLNPAWAHEQTLGARLSAALRQWAYKLRHHGAHLRDIGPLYGVIYLVDRVAALAHYRAETAAAHLALPVANTGYRRAMLNYQPSPLAANALLVRFHGRRLDAPDLGWEGLLAHGYDLVDLPLEPRGALAGESAIRVGQVLNERLFRFPQLPNDTKG
jgi:thioesterase domain-containing protein